MTKQPKTVVKEEDGFARLGARLAKVTKRAVFSAWLAEGANYEHLKTQIDLYGARWDEIAQWAFDEGFTGDKPVTAVAAKRAFERETDRREKRQKPAATSAGQATPPHKRTFRIEPTVPASAPQPSDDPLAAVRKEMAERSGRKK